MSAAKKQALKSIISDANSARLGKRLPEGKRERLKLLKYLKEELAEETTDGDEEGSDTDSED